MSNTVTIDTVGNALGQFCVQHSDMLTLQLKQSLEFESRLNFQPCEKTYQGRDIQSGPVLQPYQKQYTPNNAEVHKGELNTLEIGKVDMGFDLTELEKFYDTYMCNFFDVGKAEEDYTYPQYIMSNVVMPQLMEDINITSYNGIQVDPTAGTAGGMLDTFTGFKKHFADLILAGKIVPKTVGAIGDSTAVAQFEGFCQDDDDLHRELPGTIYCSKANARKYSKDYKDKNPRYISVITDPTDMYDVMDTYNKRIVGLDCMAGSERLIMVYDNKPSLIIGTRRGMPVYPQFRIHTDVREIKIVAEFYRFYGFESLEHLRLSDAA